MKFFLTLAVFAVATQSLQAQSINDSLLLYLPFNGNANDASGNGNNGTVHNATLTADRFGNPDAAYDFNGIDSYIEIPASSSLSRIYTANEVTIAAWINIRNWYQGWNVFAVFEQYDPNTDFGSVLLEANWDAGGILFASGYNANYIGCDYTWNFNEWHHLAATYSTVSDSAKFYVDGNLICTKEYNEIFSADALNSYAVGRSLSGPDEYSDGQIDELRIYDRALAENELLELPTATAGVDEHQVQAFSVYPNPASETIYCNRNKPFAHAAVSVTDMLGREVLREDDLSGDQLQINVHPFPAGTYFIHVVEAGHVSVQRILRS